MIKTFEELVRDTELYAEYTKDPNDMLQSPGISEQEAAQLKQALPKLSPIYVHLLQKYDLQRMTLGGCSFDLGTKRWGSALLVKDLIKLNQFDGDPNQISIAAEYLQRDHAYHVASREEGDPIAIVYQDGPYQKEQVLWYDLYDFNQPPIVLANAFDDFLLLLGNKDQLQYNVFDGLCTKREAKEAFFRCVREFVPDASEWTLRGWDAMTLDLDEVPRVMSQHFEGYPDMSKKPKR